MLNLAHMLISLILVLVRDLIIGGRLVVISSDAVLRSRVRRDAFLSVFVISYASSLLTYTQPNSVHEVAY